MTDGRCLSCPIRSQEAENLSLSDGKGNIEDSPPLSIIAAETLYFDDLHSIPPHVHGVSHLHADYSRLTRLHNPLHSSFFQFLFLPRQLLAGSSRHAPQPLYKAAPLVSLFTMHKRKYKKRSLSASSIFHDVLYAQLLTLIYDERQVLRKTLFCELQQGFHFLILDV